MGEEMTSAAVFGMRSRGEVEAEFIIEFMYGVHLCYVILHGVEAVTALHALLETNSWKG